MVRDYIQNSVGADERAVATALRPILESFMRVAYPQWFHRVRYLDNSLLVASNKRAQRTKSCHLLTELNLGLCLIMPIYFTTIQIPRGKLPLSMTTSYWIFHGAFLTSLEDEPQKMTSNPYEKN